MPELLGPKGLLTNILGFGVFIPASLLIVLIGYVVMKDLPIMDRQGRYMNFFFENRKREWKAMLSLWLILAMLLAGTAISSKF
ncbi:hypothetical protein [Mesorhizobium sp. STM 4661]|uniref:hypothetical protein n=1 Tax=Mesorhizobium sp. STM 4661 TaxID=1297570 RepID=UPI0012FCCD3B|nr:hypothetical protein [Mesorhizobium sp. STM 4661]